MTKPTENELFEQWFNKQLDSGYAFTSDEQITRWAWNAAIANQSAEIAHYKAQINELREALEVCKYDCHTGEVIGVAQQALAKTAPQCLQEHDNEVIERCAKLCDNAVLQGTYSLSKAIRALKGTQNV